MSNNKQTAVIQLLKYILVDCRNENGNIQFHANETFNKFLELEKQQIIDAYRFPNTLVDMSSEQYYNETFKNK
jgi:hypothetical protein